MSSRLPAIGPIIAPLLKVRFKYVKAAPSKKYYPLHKARMLPTTLIVKARK